MTSASASSNPVRHSVLVRAGSGAIWKALTTKEGLEGWFAQRAEVRLRKGGRLHLWWEDWGPDAYTGGAEAAIEVVSHRKRFVFTWKSHATHPETRVDVRLEARGPITVVRLEETGFSKRVDAALANAAGWGEALTLLKFYVEHGVRY